MIIARYAEPCGAGSLQESFNPIARRSSSGSPKRWSASRRRAPRGRFRRGRRVRLACRAARPAAGRQGQPRRPAAPEGHRPLARHADREHDALRRRPAGQQRAALGRARHGQELAGQGGARGGRGGAAEGCAAAEAGRDPSRGHRDAAGADAARCATGSERFILFCDDLSFDAGDTSYKSLKAALEGGIEGRPDNVVFYATSNRRHLMPRDMMENERSTAINPSEAVQEKVSLSDRFGLWLGFHNCSQDDFLAMVAGYVAHFASAGGGGGVAARGARMGDDARQPLRPRRLAVRAGSGGAEGREAGVGTLASRHAGHDRARDRSTPHPHGSVAGHPARRRLRAVLSSPSDAAAGRPAWRPCAARNAPAAW